jgi:hypothetical protein
MTTQDLGRELGPGAQRRETALDDDAALGVLFARSPALPVHTSAAAEVGFLAGLLALLTVPFTLMLALSCGLAVVALLSSILGLARASRPVVAGSLLASLGLVLSLATAGLVALRYIGIDTAFGDGAVPTLADWLRTLNDLLPPL